MTTRSIAETVGAWVDANLLPQVRMDTLAAREAWRRANLNTQPATQAALAAPWRAIEFALTIDDHFDRRQFLEDVLHGDLVDWPDFVAFAKDRAK